MADWMWERLVALEQRVAALEAKIDPKPPAPQRAARIAADWQPDLELLAWVKEKFPDVDEGLEREKFRDYWLAKGEPRKDWTAGYRNWIRRAEDYRARDAGRGQRNGPFASRTAAIDAANRERIDSTIDRLTQAWQSKRS